MAEPTPRIHHSIDEIPAAAWNALAVGGGPFLRHEFLAAMEHHRCVGEHFGWLPRHLALYRGERLIGALPLYAKHNGYGELVFDHAWEDAYRRLGMRYYPKLVSAIPYTPVTGPRLLATSGEAVEVGRRLSAAARELALEEGASGVHWLFPGEAEAERLSAEGMVIRHDCQFHWENRGYGDFDDFLATLTARRRKEIRRERRRVAEAGVTFRVLDGHTATEGDWRDFVRFYNRTFEEKWGMATFNHGFFTEVAARMPECVVLVLAERGGRAAAGALMYRDEQTLYGRHWGCDERIEFLHFEACYYRGIDYCIEHGLKRFEPGAQGEHKLPRGFLPAVTRSAHWLTDERLRPAVADFCVRERAAVAGYMDELSRSSPYRSE